MATPTPVTPAPESVERGGARTGRQGVPDAGVTVRETLEVRETQEPRPRRPRRGTSAARRVMGSASAARAAASAASASVVGPAAQALTDLASSGTSALKSAMPADQAARDTLEVLLPPDLAGRPARIGHMPQLGAVDPARLAQALGEALGRALVQPSTYSGPVKKHVRGVGSAVATSAARLIGRRPDGPRLPDARDTRFDDGLWRSSALHHLVMEMYLLNRDLLEEVVAAADLPSKKQARARMAAGLLGDALAPTNFLLSNPEALRTALHTRGGSLAGGLRNLAHDVIYNDGWPSQVDVKPFAVGENIACTSGKVIFRNELIELIQYAPTTETVHEIPLLLCPPWINKYYIFDLAPGKSLVEWAVSHGMTTFVISYRNPDGAQRDLSFADYLDLGPRAAVDAVRTITGAPSVNLLSACIGGTLTTAMLAQLEAAGESEAVNSSTLLNCLIDHEDAGTLSSVYADEETIAGIERKTAATGYLEAGDMAHTFDLLRPNDLVFRYVRANWLNGKQPPAFDMLAWNGDATRMPATMLSDYLRKCWLENALAHDEMELRGRKVKVSDIRTDTYIVAAVDDHIVPWRSSYKTAGLMKSPSRFVLSSSGHIAGIINPPSPKARLWTNDEVGSDPDAWLAGAEKSERSWWQDWAEWIEPRAGARISPPALGTPAHPVLADAPGTYVLTR